jgi:Kef-type K+ transport system membrane component KefB
LQAAGGAVSTVSRGVSQRGIDIAMVGLILQVAVLVIFIALFGDYMARYLRSQVTQRFTARETSFFICLALATVLILARCAYRCYELKEGYTHSELITNESLFIVLEGA